MKTNKEANRQSGRGYRSVFKSPRLEDEMGENDAERAKVTFTNKHGVTVTRRPRGPANIVVDHQPNTARGPGDDGWVDLLKWLFKYNPDTGVITRRRKMNKSAPAGSVVGTPCLGYLRATALRRAIGCHVLAWALHYGEWPAMHIDHINCNRQDNRIDNLRLATAAQNMFNSRISRTNTSGIKGVSWNKAMGKWHAYVRRENVSHHCGFFDNLVDADAAVRTAREVLHGKYARHA